MPFPTVTPYVLPGLEKADVSEWQTLRFGELELRFPRLTPEQLDRAISRWLEPHSGWRRLAESASGGLPAVTGYPEVIVRKGLAGYLATFRLENTRRLLEAEFGDPRFLDEFRPRG